MKNEKITENLLEEIAEEATEEVAEEMTAEVKKKKEPRTLEQMKAAYFIITGIIILFVIMAFYTAYEVRDYKEALKNSAVAETEVIEEPTEIAHHLNSYGYDSWTINYRTADDGINLQYYYTNKDGERVVLPADHVNKLLNEEVATCGNSVLTNRLLQNYYFETYANFMSYYSDYVAYIMDTTLPLDGQLDGTLGDGTGTWQKTFLEDALNTYQVTACLVQEAEATGFVLTEEQQAQIDTACDLETQAQQYGMTSGLELVKAAIGPAATVESYQQYARDTLIASFYMEHLTAQIEVTDEDAMAYYEANQDQFTGEAAKDNVDVRHILIQPEAAEDGTVTDAAWAVAEKEANRILKEFTSGEQTEEAFGTLATTYTTDPGSMETGGLYEGVYPGQMVPTFNDWCFDETRAVGDTGVVKTDYGYHIMYFVGESDLWLETAKTAIQSDKVTQLREEILAKYKTNMNMPRMIILEMEQTTQTQGAYIQ